MAAERIGRARCPLCGTSRARLSLSRSGLACLTCDGCNLQVFARSSTSDELLRRQHLPGDGTEPAPAEPNAAPAPRPAPRPAPAAAPRPEPAPAARPGWGFLAGAEA
jgi:hypothetical protein